VEWEIAIYVVDDCSFGEPPNCSDLGDLPDPSPRGAITFANLVINGPSSSDFRIGTPQDLTELLSWTVTAKIDLKDRWTN
jgi:hypothetical protein